MAKRTYVSPVRDAAMLEKRANMIEAASRLLREPNAVASFSLDAVAREAGVTRLTVYNQFGSRRGVLEEVFDRIAERGGLQRIPGALAEPDPRTALNKLVAIFCDFWASDPAIGHLHDAMVLDGEFAQSLLARNEQRRGIVADLVRKAVPTASDNDRRDVTDLIFALTGQAMFRVVSTRRSLKRIRVLIQTACDDALRRLDRTG